MVTKAVIAQIELGIITTEGLMLPNGDYAVAVSQVANIFSLPKNHATREIQSLLGEGFTFKKTESELNSKPVNVILIEDFKKVVLALALKGNTLAIDLWNKAYPDSLIYQAKTKAPRKKKQGYIYLFEGINILKLGYSTNVKQRLKMLSRWDGELELVAKVRGDITKEKAIHSTLHLRGEYFGDEWYPLYRKNEILQLMDATSTISADELVIKALDTF